MSQPTPQRRSPIIQALLSITVAPSANPALESLLLFCDGERREYPTLQPTQERTDKAAPTGFVGTSKDEHRRYEARQDAFVFLWLGAYPGWETFQKEAARLWARYQTRLTPLHLTRLRLQTRSRFDLPGDSVSLDEYFNTYPEVSAGIEGAMTHFRMTATCPHPALHSELMLTVEPIAVPEHPGASILLEIELTRLAVLPQPTDAVWPVFEELQKLSETTMNACITQKTQELLR